MELVAGGGFEPPTVGLWARCAAELRHPAVVWVERFELPVATSQTSWLTRLAHTQLQA